MNQNRVPYGDEINHYYKLYLGKNKDLARSIVVNFRRTALAINEWVKGRFNIPVSDDPRTWRYYLNVAGEYHETNKRMYVTSMDTLEEIEFNKENLKVHRATLREYQFGTRPYEELVARYPHQEILILGILYPADLEKAVNAKDGEILSYPPFLVEENEYHFIHHLQEWIYGYIKHHFNPGYSFTDSLYSTAVLGLMYINMVPAMLNIRKQACKTNEVHSYHVRQFLASHGFLDDYLDTMTRRQALRFYQNINWIERNIGKRETQQWLIREILSVRGFPLAEYILNHDTEHQPDQLLSRSVFKKKGINNLEHISSVDDLSVEELLAKEVPLAPGNKRYIDDNGLLIENKLSLSLSNVLQTKVLESKVVDYTNYKVHKLSDTLIDMWINLSAEKVYKAFIQINIPKTGERVPLISGDAFVLFVYAWCMWMYGRAPEVIPEMVVGKVPRKILYNRDVLKRVLPKGCGIDGLWMNEVLGLMEPYPVSIISVEAFYEHAYAVNQAMNIQHHMVSIEEHRKWHAFKELAVSQLYTMKHVSLAKDGETYRDWLEDRNIVFKDFSSEDYGRLARSILDEATGINLNTKLSVRVIHAAMIRLITQLSSYSVQFIREITDDKTILSTHSYLRLDDINSKVSSDKEVELDIEVLDIKNETHRDLGYIGIVDCDITIDQSSKSNIFIPAVVDAKPLYINESDFRGMEPLDIFVVSTGYDEVSQMTPEEARAIYDPFGQNHEYQESCNKVPNGLEPLSWSLPISDLVGWRYQRPEFKLEHGGGFGYSEGNLVDISDVSVFKITILNGIKDDHAKELKLDSTNGTGWGYDNKPFAIPDAPLYPLNLNDKGNGWSYDVGEGKEIDKAQDIGFVFPETTLSGIKDDYIAPVDIRTVFPNTVLNGLRDGEHLYNLTELFPVTILNGIKNDIEPLHDIRELFPKTELGGLIDTGELLDIRVLFPNTTLKGIKDDVDYKDIREVFPVTVLDGIKDDPVAVDIREVFPNTVLDGIKEEKVIKTVDIASVFPVTILDGIKEEGFGNSLGAYEDRTMNGFYKAEEEYLDDRIRPNVAQTTLSGFAPNLTSIQEGSEEPIVTEVTLGVDWGETYNLSGEDIHYDMNTGEIS